MRIVWPLVLAGIMTLQHPVGGLSSPASWSGRAAGMAWKSPKQAVTVVLVDTLPRADLAVEVVRRPTGPDATLILIRRTYLSPAVVIWAERSLRSSIRRVPDTGPRGVRLFIHAGPRLPQFSGEALGVARAVVERLLAAHARNVSGIGTYRAVSVAITVQ